MRSIHRRLVMLLATASVPLAIMGGGCSSNTVSESESSSTPIEANAGILVGVEVDGVRVILSYEPNGVWVASLGRSGAVEKLMAHYLAFEMTADGSSWDAYDYYVSDHEIDDAEWRAIAGALEDARTRQHRFVGKLGKAPLAVARPDLAPRDFPPTLPPPTQLPPPPVQRLPPLPPLNRLPPIAPSPGTQLPPLPGRPPGLIPRPTPQPLPPRPGAQPGQPSNGVIWALIVAQAGQQIVQNVTARPPALPTVSVPRIQPVATLPPIVIPVPAQPPTPPDAGADASDGGRACEGARWVELQRAVDAQCKTDYPNNCATYAGDNGGVSLNTICTGLRNRYNRFEACRDARQRVQDECFPGSTDKGHQDEIDKAAGLRDVCAELLRDKSCPNAPVAASDTKK